MKKEYDFRQAKRGAVVPVPRGKTRITIRLDEDVVEGSPRPALREARSGGAGDARQVVGCDRRW